MVFEGEINFSLNISRFLKLELSIIVNSECFKSNVKFVKSIVRRSRGKFQSLKTK